MSLRRGLQGLIGLSALGIAVALFLIFTCPFAGQLAFGALMRQVPMAHSSGAEEHGGQHRAEMPTPHEETEKQAGQGPHTPAETAHQAVANHHGDRQGLSVHLMVLPGVRGYPIQETRIVSVDISSLGIVVLLLLIALSLLLLRQRPVVVLGHTVTSKTIGVMVVLITWWNLLVALFLVGVEAIHFRELCLT
jgi:hypothetical protein